MGDLVTPPGGGKSQRERDISDTAGCNTTLGSDK